MTQVIPELWECASCSQLHGQTVWGTATHFVESTRGQLYVDTAGPEDEQPYLVPLPDEARTVPVTEYQCPRCGGIEPASHTCWCVEIQARKLREAGCDYNNIKHVAEEIGHPEAGRGRWAYQRDPVMESRSARRKVAPPPADGAQALERIEARAYPAWIRPPARAPEETRQVPHQSIVKQIMEQWLGVSPWEPGYHRLVREFERWWAMGGSARQFVAMKTGRDVIPPPPDPDLVGLSGIAAIPKFSK